MKANEAAIHIGILDRRLLVCGKIEGSTGCIQPGATLNELEENIQDAYSSMLDEEPL